MNSNGSLLLLVLAAVLALASCSGQKTTCTTNCGSGNATVNVTIFDTPPAGVSILSFSLPIVGISLTPSTGSAVSIYSPTTITPTELTRLETDTAVITTGATVAAGMYTSINVTVATSSGVFINYSGSTITGGKPSSCIFGAVCQLPNGAAATISIPINLTLNGSQNQWIGLDVNLNNAVISPTSTSIAVDFTQPKTITAVTTARVGIPAGGVDTIEDFIGVVTAVSSSSISVQSGITGKTITAAVNSSTQLDMAPTNYSGCTTAASCIVVGSVDTIDDLLKKNGTNDPIEIDALDSVSTNEVEGVIYPTAAGAGVVGLILADKATSATAADPILALSTTTYGTGILLTASSNINYSVDTKTLTNAPGLSTIGFAGSGDLLAGQVVRAHVSGVTSTATGIQATATNVLLRWSRLSATVNLVSSPNFTITKIPTYIASLNPTLSLTPLVYTYSPGTSFDGVTSTTDANFVTGKSLAIRALYLNNNLPAFQAAKVRVP